MRGLWEQIDGPQALQSPSARLEHFPIPREARGAACDIDQPIGGIAREKLSHLRVESSAGRIDDHVAEPVNVELREHVLDLAREPAAFNSICRRVLPGHIDGRLHDLNAEDGAMLSTNNHTDGTHPAVQVEQSGVVTITQGFSDGLKQDLGPLRVDLKEGLMRQRQLHPSHLQADRRISPDLARLTRRHIA